MTRRDPALKQLASFIDEQWNHPPASEPDETWFEGYERLYESGQSPPKLGPKKKEGRRVVDKGEDLDLDWADFVELIGQQERRSLWTGGTVHVFDHPGGSYLQDRAREDLSVPVHPRAQQPGAQDAGAM